jgi:hypothetical protein
MRIDNEQNERFADLTDLTDLTDSKMLNEQKKMKLIEGHGISRDKRDIT